MGILQNEETGDQIVLEASHLVGRSDHCSLQLKSLHVSAEHASIRWDGEQWLLRDLGSCNSTFLDGEPLPQSSTVVLRAGNRIAFGDALHSYVMLCNDEPRTLAQPVNGAAPLVAEAGILVLPSKEKPVLTVYRSASGEWVVDTGRAIEPAVHRALIEVDGAAYRLHLAHAIAKTTPLQSIVHRQVASLCLEFLVSRDEEHIELRARLGNELHDFGARSHNELLLFLARRRLEDAAAREPPTACGWVFQEELCDSLRTDPERLNVDVYRVRRQIATLKLSDPAEIIQRRPRTKQIRLGTDCCTVQAI